MALALEARIRELFEEHGSLDPVVDTLTQQWERNLLSPDEQRALARFLLRAGKYKKLCVQLRRLLSSKQRLPWAELASAIIDSGIELSGEEKRALTEGISEQDASHEALEIPEVISWNTIFEKKNVEREAKLSQELVQRREFLKDKINYFRSQRMYREEAAAIAELRAIFPQDADLPAEQQSADEKWAYDVVAQGATERDLSESLSKKIAELTSEQKEIKAVLVRSAQQEVNRKPENAYNLALHLHFMDFHEEAIELLESSGRPLQHPELWLRLELMIKSRRFLEALEETHLLEEKFADEPEAVFAAIYARSICLWELHQAPLAVELLKSIVRIRPGYRSAHSLLTAWTGGDF